VDVIPLMIFVSLGLVSLALIFFALMVKEHTFEHSDRLALLPLLDDDPKPKDELAPSTDDPQEPTSGDE